VVIKGFALCGRKDTLVKKMKMVYFIVAVHGLKLDGLKLEIGKER
jgi:hypothetical protein